MLHHRSLQSKKTSLLCLLLQQSYYTLGKNKGGHSVATQRAHVRYTPNCDAFISLGAGFTRVGSIRDISLTGAAFEHFPYNQLVPPFELSADIFICRTEMHSANIPCRIVYELPMPENSADWPLDRTMTQKRCGIEFKPGNGHHQEQLARFRRQYIQTPIET